MHSRPSLMILMLMWCNILPLYTYRISFILDFNCNLISLCGYHETINKSLLEFSPFSVATYTRRKYRPKSFDSHHSFYILFGNYIFMLCCTLEHVNASKPKLKLSIRPLKIYGLTQNVWYAAFHFIM